jgi:ubiquinone/menaquinone biosynthesis C-methylase UbiE
LSLRLRRRQRPLSFSSGAGKIGYGIDEYRTIITLVAAGVLAVVVGFIVSAYTVSTQPEEARLGLIVGPAVGGLILAVAAALYWSSRLGKEREMEKLIARIPFGGEETVLDIGCGRGLGMVKAAAKLRSGLSLGVDTWHRAHLSGNNPASIWTNAEAEKVSNRVVAVMALPTNLPLLEKSVDVVVSAVALHRIVKMKDRPALFAEMARVLKEGGRVGVLDAGNGNEYSEYFKRNGLLDIEMHRMRFSGFPPFHVVLARKPYG